MIWLELVAAKVSTGNKNWQFVETAPKDLVAKTSTKSILTFLCSCSKKNTNKK